MDFSQIQLPTCKYECKFNHKRKSRLNTILNSRFGSHSRCTVRFLINATKSLKLLLIIIYRIHGWGTSLKEAFEQCGIGMYGYMTELPFVEIKQTAQIEATGHDLESLLFHFLDELLFLFSCEPFLICNKVEITEFTAKDDDFRIVCTCYGEEFEIGKHPQGTEVKAITYSAMQIVKEPEKSNYEVFVIIDI